METRTPSTVMKMCVQGSAVPQKATRVGEHTTRVISLWIIGTFAVRVLCVVFLGLVHYINKRLLVVIIVLKVDTNLLNRNSRAFCDVKFVLNTRVEKRRLPVLNLSPVLKRVRVGLQR